MPKRDFNILIVQIYSLVGNFPLISVESICMLFAGQLPGAFVSFHTDNSTDEVKGII